jgi:hypothetical protein
VIRKSAMWISPPMFCCSSLIISVAGTLYKYYVGIFDMRIALFTTQPHSTRCTDRLCVTRPQQCHLPRYTTLARDSTTESNPAMVCRIFICMELPLEHVSDVCLIRPGTMCI